MVEIKTLDDSPQARGMRLKKIRALTGLNGEELAEKIGYSRQTISYWENVTYGGLSVKGAKKIVEALQALDMHCDLDWLLYGIVKNQSEAIAVHHTQSSNPANKNTQWLLQQLTSQEPLFQEISLFKQCYPNAVILQLQEPLLIYEPGDWVGGHFETLHAQLFGKICIVEVSGSLMIKSIQPSLLNSMVCLQSPMPSSNKLSEPNIDINVMALGKAAEIIRVWKQF